MYKETTVSISSFDTIDNPVVIMAGGLGTRLYPLTKETPKPMLLINGKPILERIIEKLITQGFQNFYISINYLGEQIKDYFQVGNLYIKTKENKCSFKIQSIKDLKIIINHLDLFKFYYKIF